MSVKNKKQNQEEKELEILRNFVDEVEIKAEEKIAKSPEMKKIIGFVEKFISKKKLICYGGTAINAILPKEDQFYDRDMEVPDYDFFSPNALNDAIELSDLFHKEGYLNVEAKAAVHHGTYKVFVNFIGVADVTNIDKNLFKIISKQAIKIDGIFYAPPNFLKIDMYKELSRPNGDVSRYEKVFKRLALINKHYPLKNKKCDSMNFQRDFEGTDDKETIRNLYNVIKNAIISQGLIFFGGYASALYSKYMPKNQKHVISIAPDFDVLAQDPKAAAMKVKEELKKAGFKNIKINEKKPIGEIIETHYEIVVDNDTVCFIYAPNGCHSYNTIKIGNKKAKIATINTMLNFFYAFVFSEREYYDQERILCMAQYLTEVQLKNGLNQTGILNRFNQKCYGTELTREMVKEIKANKYKELKVDKNSSEYQSYFLKYTPGVKNADLPITAAPSTAGPAAIHKTFKKTLKNKNRKNSKINKSGTLKKWYKKIFDI
jgi:hypothetical protein